jgi:hypothetical protein
VTPRRRGAVPVLVLAVAVSGAATRAPRPEAPPLAHTGGFGEPTCRSCHADGDPLGARDGAFAITGLPARYVPGRTYEIVLVLERPGLRRAGFELAVRFAPGQPSEALQAGTLAPADTARAAVERDAVTGVDYGHHTLAGTTPPVPGSARWAIRWTAPAGREAVVVHAVAVAADDDNSNLGDEVYARALVVPAAP